MKKISLTDRLVNYLKKRGDWVNGGELERLAMEVGYKGSTASRRIREAREAGVLEAEDRKGKNGIESVWYRAKSRLKPVHYYANGVKILTKWEPVEVK